MSQDAEFLGPCSCADEGRCRHNITGPLCMQDTSTGESIEHDVASRIDWEGDPDVINGTRSWETPYCKVCHAEGDELEGPCR